MSRTALLRALAGGVLLVSGVLAGVPAQAETVDSYTGWVHREDATAPATDTTYTWPGPDTGLHISSWDGQLTVYPDSASSFDVGAHFVPPVGQTLHAGATYRADVTPDEPTATVGRLQVWNGLTMCQKTEDQFVVGYLPINPATGWFHISELEYDGQGQVVRFAATYEMNCQFADGVPGFEGSVAVNASAPPAPVPDAPPTPGPVTGLHAVNVGPDGGGTNSTTLSWTNPAGFGNVVVDMVQSTSAANLPAVVGMQYVVQFSGRASSYYDGRVEFMDSRTYRVVPRGATGRLGPASVITVLGTRLDIPDPKRIMIGQEVQFTGRLSEAWDYVRPADVMKGPGLVGRTVLLCRQSSVDYVDGDCTVVDRATTTTGGYFTLSATPGRNQLYNVVVPATPQLVGNTSRVVNALVTPRTDLKAAESVPTARASVLRGAAIHFTTSRARTGSRGFVRLQRFDGHRWRTVVTRSLDAGSTRRLALPYREQVRGLHAYRVIKPGDSHHATGRSRVIRIRVS